MTRILCTAALISAALAIAVGHAAAQQTSNENQPTEAPQQSQSGSAQQSQPDEQPQTANQAESTDSTEAGGSEAQSRGQHRDRQQQARQRSGDDRQQRGRESREWTGDQRDRGQTTWNDNRDGVRPWPQPDGDDYGSDSLDYRTQDDGSSDAQRSDSRPAGLGVNVASDGRGGVVVVRVHPGSPADEMGIRERDRITQVNGRQVQSVQEFIGRIRNMEPGQQVELDIRRAAGGGEQTVRGELESRAEALANADSQQYDREERDTYSQQTPYDDRRVEYDQPSATRQAGAARIEQLEQQVDRLSRELDDLRVALQNMRRQSPAATEWNRERTASFDEYPGASNSPRGARSDSDAEYRDGAPRDSQGIESRSDDSETGSRRIFNRRTERSGRILGEGVDRD